MIWVIVIGLLAAIYVVYTLLPDLLFKLLHFGTLYRGPATARTVALTFDDGPDAAYTPQVLDILREHAVRATFFVVGERVEAHPQLVRLMSEDGHEVASHGYIHRHAWFRDPISTWRDIKQAKHLSESLMNGRVRYYRPPWGDFNLATKLATLWLRMKPTLWSARAIDWLPGEYADEVVERVVNSARPGVIVLCHDAGGAPGAPNNMVAALPKIIARLQQLGYSFATVADMDMALAHHRQTMRSLFANYPPARKALISIWSIVEFIFAKLFKVESVNSIFRIGFTVWRHGDRVDADTGDTVVHQDARAIELHFQNETMIAISSAHDNRSLIRGLRQAKAGFRDLASMLLHDPRFRDVEVVVAPTLMNRGLDMLGFHVEELPDSSSKRRLEGYMRFLMGMYHPDGFARLSQGRRELTLKLVWMSKADLLRLYGEK